MWCAWPLTLYLAHRHASGLQRDDLVIKADPASLVLGDELWLEAAVVVTGYLYGQLSQIALEGLLAFAVAAGVGHRFAAFMAEVLGQLGV
jgi:hypothetical protein